MRRVTLSRCSPGHQPPWRARACDMPRRHSHNTLVCRAEGTLNSRHLKGVSVQCRQLTKRAAAARTKSDCDSGPALLLSFIAEVNSVRTNLSPFTKGYRGLASRMQFDPIYERRASLSRGALTIVVDCGLTTITSIIPILILRWAFAKLSSPAPCMEAHHRRRAQLRRA